MQLHLQSSVVEPSVSAGINRSAQSSSHPAFKSLLEVVLQKPSAEEDKHRNPWGPAPPLVPPLLFYFILFFFFAYSHFPTTLYILNKWHFELQIEETSGGLSLSFYCVSRRSYFVDFGIEFQTAQMNVHLGLLQRRLVVMAPLAWYVFGSSRCEEEMASLHSLSLKKNLSMLRNLASMIWICDPNSFFTNSSS